jgi:hypothetical protein
MKGLAKLLLGLLAGGAVALGFLSSSHAGFFSAPLAKAITTSVLALAAGALLVGNGLRDLWMRRADGTKASLDYLARRTRDDIVAAAKHPNGSPTYTLDDIGVHIYVVQRRTTVPWRFELLRQARSSKAMRVRNASNDRESQHWRHKGVPGIAAAAWQATGTDVQATDLQGPLYAHVTEDRWNALLRNRDPRTFHRLWEEISVTRKNFAAILAAPIVTDRGKKVGVITVNIESHVTDGLAKLEAANIREILKRAQGDAGHLVLN